MQFKIKFSGKSHNYTEEEIETVVQAMKDAEPYTQGRYQKEFEEKFCEYIGVPHAFAVNNATSALEMAAQLCQFESGDEVIIPSHTFTSSAYPFAKKGAKIVWADIDLQTRVVTSEIIEKKITPNTKAVVVVHLYGYGFEDPLGVAMRITWRWLIGLYRDALSLPCSVRSSEQIRVIERIIVH